MLKVSLICQLLLKKYLISQLLFYTVPINQLHLKVFMLHCNKEDPYCDAVTECNINLNRLKYTSTHVYFAF